MNSYLHNILDDIQAKIATTTGLKYLTTPDEKKLNSFWLNYNDFSYNNLTSESYKKYYVEYEVNCELQVAVKIKKSNEMDLNLQDGSAYYLELIMYDLGFLQDKKISFENEFGDILKANYSINDISALGGGFAPNTELTIITINFNIKYNKEI